MSTQVSEITTLSELLEKVEEYKATTSHLRIAHPGIGEISWEIPDLPIRLVTQLSNQCGTRLTTIGASLTTLIAGDGYYIHAVSVPVE